MNVLAIATAAYSISTLPVAGRSEKIFNLYNWVFRECEWIFAVEADKPHLPLEFFAPHNILAACSGRVTLCG